MFRMKPGDSARANPLAPLAFAGAAALAALSARRVFREASALSWGILADRPFAPELDHEDASSAYP